MQERLNKLLAQAGIASRRAADELIEAGLVSVNGEIVRALGTKADSETDHIKVNGKLINKRLEKRANVYVLVNKPKGYLSSSADPEGRKLVTDLVRGFGRVHPVGRLDYNTEGLIILTNDGEFTNVVASSRKVAKIYEVKVKGIPNDNAINKLRRGITLDDNFKTAPAEIKTLKATEHNAWFEVTLYEGHNQQIRRMFDAVGNSVVKLRRIAIGHVKDERMPVGAYRALDEEEVREFLNPNPKPRKAVANDAKPRVHSRHLTPKKPKVLRAARKPNAAAPAKAKRAANDASKSKKFDSRAQPETISARAVASPDKKKRRPPNADTGLSKFKNASTRKPKR